MRKQIIEKGTLLCYGRTTK